MQHHFADTLRARRIARRNAMKILVVDDERLLVKGIKFNLENEGYTVDAGYDGEEAVAFLL